MLLPALRGFAHHRAAIFGGAMSLILQSPRLRTIEQVAEAMQKALRPVTRLTIRPVVYRADAVAAVLMATLRRRRSIPRPAIALPNNTKLAGSGTGRSWLEPL